MDLVGLAALLGVPAAAATAIWVIVSERSRLKTLERLVALGKELDTNKAARGAVEELQTVLARRLLRDYSEPHLLRNAVFGLALVLVGITGAVLIAAASPQLFDSKHVFKPLDVLALLGLLLSVLVAVSGYVMAMTGMVFLTIDVSRQIGRRRQRGGSQSRKNGS